MDYRKKEKKEMLCNDILCFGTMLHVAMVFKGGNVSYRDEICKQHFFFFLNGLCVTCIAQLNFNFPCMVVTHREEKVNHLGKEVQFVTSLNKLIQA